MTPKEKAEELTNKFYNAMNPDAPDCNISIRQAKQCAKIAVEEMKKMLPFPNDEWHEERMSFLDEVLTHLNT
jgi:hypothetical protein